MEDERNVYGLSEESARWLKEASTLLSKGRDRAAADALEQAIAGQLQLGTDDGVGLAVLLESRARALCRQWHLERAEGDVKNALEIICALRGAGGIDLDALLAQALNTRGEILELDHRREEAREQFKLARELVEGASARAVQQGQGPMPWTERARALTGLARWAVEQGDFVDAIALCGEVLTPGGPRVPQLQVELSAVSLRCNAWVQSGLGVEAIADFRRRAAMMVPEQAAAVAAAAAHFSRMHAEAAFASGDLKGAEEHGQRSIEICRALIAQDEPHHRFELGSAMSVVARALTRAGRLEAARGLLERAVTELESVGELSRRTNVRWVRAHIDIDLGNVLADQGRLDAASARYNSARKELRSLLRDDPSAQLKYLTMLGRAEVNLGNVLAEDNRFDLASRIQEQAVWRYDRAFDICHTGNQDNRESAVQFMPASVMGMARAHALYSLATTRGNFGDWDGALSNCRAAVEQLQPGISPLDGSQDEAILPVSTRVLLGRTKVLLACIELARGERRTAGRLVLASLLSFKRLLRHEGTAGNGQSNNILAECASASMALGDALAEDADFEGAIRCHRLALKVFTRLIDRRMEHYGLKIAHAHTSLGNALRRLDRNDGAAAKRHLDLAASILGGLIPTRVELVRPMAFVHRSLGDALSSLGKDVSADRHYEAALRLVGPTGSTDYAFAHSVEWALVLGRYARHLQRGGRDLARVHFKTVESALLKQIEFDWPGPEAWRAEWLHAQINVATSGQSPDIPLLRSMWHMASRLAMPDEVPSSFNPNFFGPAMRAGLELLRAHWRRPNPHAEMAALISSLKELAGPASARPNFERGYLRTLEQTIDVLEEAGRIAIVHFEAGARLPLIRLGLEWLAVLARDGDPLWLSQKYTAARMRVAIERLQHLATESVALRADWFIHCFALRSTRDWKPLDELDALALDEPGSPRHSHAEMLDRERLRGEGPGREQDVLTVDTLCARMHERGGRRTALVLICPAPRMGDGECRAIWTFTIGGLAGNRPRIDFKELPVDRGFDFPAAKSKPALHLEAWKRAYPALYAFARNQLLPLIKDAVAPSRDDYKEVAMIASPELSSFPWRLMLGRFDGDARIAVYPSVGVWLHSRPPVAADPTWATKMHVVLLAHDSYDEQRRGWLPWASIEARLSLRLLFGSRSGCSIRTLDRAADSAADGAGPPAFTAVFAAGHGTPSRDGHWHSAIRVPDVGRDGMLTAGRIEDLGAIEFVFANACVLGYTRLFLGEGFGMFFRLFNRSRSIRAAVGCVGEVDDLAACLISLAFQHALWARHEGNDVKPSERSGVFVDVQLGLAEGKWPGSFDHWLTASLPGAMAEELRAHPDRREAWFHVLTGRGNPFELASIEPMRAGEADDWTEDIKRLARALTGAVRLFIKRQLRNYIAFGH